MPCFPNPSVQPNKWVMNENGKKDNEPYMLKSTESVSHGYICNVCWDLVLLAQSLELLPREAVEIHVNQKPKDSKQAVSIYARNARIRAERMCWREMTMDGEERVYISARRGRQTFKNRKP